MVPPGSPLEVWQRGNVTEVWRNNYLIQNEFDHAFRNCQLPKLFLVQVRLRDNHRYTFEQFHQNFWCFQKQCHIWPWTIFCQTCRKNHLKIFQISLWKMKTDLSAVSQIVKSSRSPVSAWGSSKQPNKQSWSCPIINSPLSSIINSSSVCNTEELKWFPST